MSRVTITKLLRSLINSNHAIKLSLDKPLNNGISLNITRPAVLRQYFGKDIMPTPSNEKHTCRYNYGSGSRLTLVGMDPRNSVTRKLTPGMECITNE